MKEMNEYERACALIDTAVSQFGLSETQAKGLHDAHDIAFRNGLDGVQYVTLTGEPLLDPRDNLNAADVSGFLRAVRRDRPELLTAAAASTKSEVPARPQNRSEPPTLTQAFVAAKAGDNSLFEQMMTGKSSNYKASGKKINLTQAMVKAKAGDRSDLDAFEESLKA